MGLKCISIHKIILVITKHHYLIIGVSNDILLNIDIEMIFPIFYHDIEKPNLKSIYRNIDLSIHRYHTNLP